MFRAVRVLRAVSPYTIFLIDQKNNPALKGMPITKRAKTLAQMYKKLSEEQYSELQRRAARHPKLPKRDDLRRSKHSNFSAFVKANYGKVRGLNYRKRFTALSQLYELQKPVRVGDRTINFDFGLPSATPSEATRAKKAIKTRAKAQPRRDGGRHRASKTVSKQGRKRGSGGRGQRRAAGTKRTNKRGASHNRRPITRSSHRRS